MRIGAIPVIGLTALCLVIAPPGVRGAFIGPAIPLETLAEQVDFVGKVTVVSEHAVADPWFTEIMGYEAVETELRVVSVIKGSPASRRIHFRHYAPEREPAGEPPNPPLNYGLGIGRSYLLFANALADGSYRQFSERRTGKSQQGLVLAADDAPHRGETITEAAWSELLGLTGSAIDDDVIYAISELDDMSGGSVTALEPLRDFDRQAALDAIRPLILSRSKPVATTAIGIFGRDSPYFEDRDAIYWLAGTGSWENLGVGERIPRAEPSAAAAASELLTAADSKTEPELRALAIRALGGLAPRDAAIRWLGDPVPSVRAAAAVISAAFPDPGMIRLGAQDGIAEVRVSAALAAGFSQDPALLSLLDVLVTDASAEVRDAAALSLLSFDVAESAAVLQTHLGSAYRFDFVNALARAEPQAYLPELAEIIEQSHSPPYRTLTGRLPQAEAWTTLFRYAVSRPAAELERGDLAATLDALERLAWYSSSEPRNLYALYLARGLPERARAFRERATQTIPYDMASFFDMADENPTLYLR